MIIVYCVLSLPLYTYIYIKAPPDSSMEFTTVRADILAIVVVLYSLHKSGIGYLDYGSYLGPGFEA